jgi:peptidase C39-like protein
MNPNLLFVPTLGIAGVFFLAGFLMSRKIVRRVGTSFLLIASAFFAIPGVLMVIYYFHLFDNAMWFYRFRAMRFSELSASGLGVVAGILHSNDPRDSIARRLSAPVVLLFFLMVPFIKPIISSVDFSHLKNQWEGDVCLQSIPSTCGPASAASMLKSFGQEASEKELAKECYTYTGGTENWYLARAFSRRGFDVEFVNKRETQGQIPVQAIAGVTLRSGAGHFIAVLAETPTDYVIGDPLKGKVVVSKTVANSQYHFTGFFMVVRLKATSVSRA